MRRRTRFRHHGDTAPDPQPHRIRQRLTRSPGVGSPPERQPGGPTRMAAASNDVWEVMSTARTIRRFTDEPVDDATLMRCLEAATWAPSGANAQAWRFVVLRS